jgi:hypothetical protein
MALNLRLRQQIPRVQPYPFLIMTATPLGDPDAA